MSAPTPSAATVAGAPPPHTVLVVDDTDSKRYITASWLRRAGYRVVEVATGRAALDRAAGGDVHLVVLDVHLPDIDGLEVCRRLKTGAATTAVPVLHLSAVAIDVDDRSAGLEQGADAYLVDPVEPREMLSTVAALLRHYDARRSAEHLAARLGRLSTATLRIHAALSVPQLLGAAARGAADVLETTATVLAQGEGPGEGPGEGGLWACATATPGAASVRAAAVAPGTVVPLIAPLRAPVVVVPDRHPEWAGVLPRAGAPAGQAWSVTVVRDGLDAPVAVLAVQVRAARAADEDPLVRQLGLVLAVALQNRRTYAEEHRIALTLQRALLPTAPPRVSGLAVAARYNASSDQAEIGGDFYDAFELADGTALVAIGDVQGHSLQAATIMAQLRHSLRAYAHEGHGPTALVVRLNELMLREHPEHTATLCVLALDRSRRSATLVNAGHIPPLLLAGGRAVFLERSSTLLGVQAPEPEAVAVALDPGARVVLVTDGLVERRALPLDDGLAALAEVALAHDGQDLEALADGLVRALGEDSEDDTALVALQVPPAVPGLAPPVPG